MKKRALFENYFTYVILKFSGENLKYRFILEQHKNRIFMKISFLERLNNIFIYLSCIILVSKSLINFQCESIKMV